MFRIAILCLKSKFSPVSSKFVEGKCQSILPSRSNVSVVAGVKGLLIDITGVLYESGQNHAINGSVEAFQKLRSQNMPFKFVTNESTSIRSALSKKLQSFGFNISEEDILSPGVAASLYIQQMKLRPYLLVHPDILPEFSNCDQSSPNCVVVGDAGEHFTFENMNHAFSVLMKTEDPVLISLGKGKYYKDKGELVMDLGGFTAALEFATGVTAKVIGKPSSDYFYSALTSLNLKACDTAMIGDDIFSDVGASQKCGFKGVLVRTGKFRQKDLESQVVKPDAVVDNFSQFVNMLF